MESIRAKPSPDAGPFGSFVDTQGNVEVGLDSLSLDIEALDGLAPAARGPALSRLEVLGMCTRPRLRYMPRDRREKGTVGEGGGGGFGRIENFKLAIMWQLSCMQQAAASLL